MTIDQAQIVHWVVTSARLVLQAGRNLFIYLLSRQEAYTYWVTDLSNITSSDYTSAEKTSIIVKAGYLIRTASIQGSTVHIVGDINATTPIQIIGAPSQVSALTFNNEQVALIKTSCVTLHGTVSFGPPYFILPSLRSLDWRYVDSLPENLSSYNDTLWPAADHPASYNPRRLTTPTSLYGSDYDFNAGTLLFRGHFLASGRETTLSLQTQGGRRGRGLIDVVV